MFMNLWQLMYSTIVSCMLQCTMAVCVFKGTELRQRYMMETAISTPEGMKTALDDPILRQYYVLDGDIQAHTKVRLSGNFI